MSWWKKLAAKFSKSEAPPPPDPGTPRAKWLEASANPFGVPVLDLISVTGKFLSTTTDPLLASRAVSWGTSVGEELDVEPLRDVAPIACELRFPIDAHASDGLLFCPQEMEHKWVLALRGDRILFARSWTGDVAAVAEGRRENGQLVIHTLRVRDEAGIAAGGNLVDTIDWLIRTHALRQNVPLPVDEVSAELLESTPILAFSLYGHMARCAAKSWTPPAPARPLRTDDRLMQAVRRADLDAVHELVGKGASLECASPTMGFRPLGVAAIKNDLALARALLELGVDPNQREDGGLTPIGRAVVHGGDVTMLDVLVGAGARVDVVNVEGFGLVHLAAEFNRAELIPWMLGLGLGLEDRTERGYTPLHIACALGHVDAAKALLDAGADLGAEANGKDALAIAREEQKDEVVALLLSRRV